MAAPQVFKVLTEFKFEAGSAIATSGALSKAVDGVSDSADQALLSFKKLSFGMVSNFLSGPGGGILGILGTAISSSEDFLKSQVALANIMGRASGSFADRMGFAEESMQNIKRMASEFGLPAKELVGVAKLVAPGLKQQFGPKRAIQEGANLGRNFLKAAPALGIDPQMGLDNLQRAVFGTIDAGDQLFKALTLDTKAMAGFTNNAKKFRELSIEKKVKLLNEAFGEFSKDLASVNRLANSVSGQFQVLKQNLVGMFSILRPLGSTISGLVVESLKRMNDFIDGPLRNTIKNLTFGLGPFVQDLDRFLVTMLQFKNLKKDLDFAGKILLLTAAFTGLKFALATLGIQVNFLSGAFALLSGVMKSAFAFIISGSFMTMLSTLGPILASVASGLVVVISSILAPLFLLVFTFQLLSRAIAIFKINQAGRIAALMEKLSESGAMFMRIIGVFDEGFNNLASLLASSPVFSFFLDLFEKLIGLFDLVNDALIGLMGMFQGLVFLILEAIEVIKEALPGVKGETAFGGNLGDAFSAGMENMFEKISGKTVDGGLPAAQTKIDVNKIEINNQFKEQMEPDRIAFSLKEQIFKAAQNPTERNGPGGSYRPVRQGN